MTTPLTSQQVGANIIAMYPSNSTSIAVGQLAIALLVMFSYPMVAPTCRICLDKNFSSNNRVSNLVLSGDVLVIDGRGAEEMSAFKHTVLTLGIVLGAFVIAYFVDDLEMGELFYGAWVWRGLNRGTVLSIVGAAGAAMVSFILPGLFFWKLTTNDPETSKLLRTSALGLALYGTLVFVFR